MPLIWPDAQHIYLSPHLDDAALSCGGLIATQARRGETVAVLTVFAASPPERAPLSAFARSLHERWREAAPPGLDFADPLAVRRAEDRRALATLGPTVRAIHHALPDCIYRAHPETGQPLYASEEAIFGAVHSADPARDDLESAPPLPPGATLYAPLGVGGHVDHQLVREAMTGWLSSGDVWYYEDFPYAAQPGALEAALVQHRGLTPELIPLSAGALEAKIEAVACYDSQISTFWQGAEAMGAALRHHAAHVGGERLWRAAR